MKTKVLIVDRIYKRSKNIFDKAADIEFVQVGKEEAQIASAIASQGAGAVVLATEKYTDSLYSAVPKDGLIARYGVGHDGIDKAKAAARGQFVTITPGVLDNSVAEHTIFLLGALAREIAVGDAGLKAGQWGKSTGMELAGKTLAILGCGAIGRKVAKIAAMGLSMNVVAFDVAKLDAQQLKRDCGISELAASMQQAVAKADVVSIHLPAIDATKDFVNAAFLANMKKTALLINTSRGSIVDEQALYDALNEGTIAGAAIDVFKKEPYEPANPDKDLRKLKNIVLTPHLGSSTNEASERMAESVIHNIRSWAAKDYAAMNRVY